MSNPARTGSTTCALTSGLSRPSRSMLLACWDDTTTVSNRTGRSAWYSTATRLAGSSFSRLSRMASLIWSQILSGCPSVTDSDVNRRRDMVSFGDEHDARDTVGDRGDDAGQVSTSRAA